MEPGPLTRFDVVDDEIAEPEFAEPFKTLATLQSTPSSRKSRNGSDKSF